ncbi:MAG: hypothetical protein KDD45_09975 [Bdellovibrionales bacterium]|nr:hypothetical protein [Bdellovibrionales bacterium]
MNTKLNSEMSEKAKHDEIRKIFKSIYTHILEIVCDTPEKQEIFLKFMFLNVRGIFECATINEIDEQSGAGIFL